MRKCLTLLLLTLITIVALDQALKARVPPLFSLGGAVGSIHIGFSQRPAPRSPLVPLAVWLLILGRMLMRARRASTAETIAFSLVLAGGLSTLYDRWHFGSIRTPFVILVSKNQILPFGVGDLAISLGGMWLCVLLAQEMITRPKRPRKNVVVS